MKTLHILFYFLLVVCATSCNKANKKVLIEISESFKDDIEIGETYLFSTNWDEKDPFRKPEVDTVTVLDEREGYYLFKFKNNTELSCSKELFDRYTKHCNYTNCCSALINN